jgi:pimeloyl-ACP methyl ester carboxylesterase
MNSRRLLCAVGALLVAAWSTAPLAQDAAPEPAGQRAGPRAGPVEGKGYTTRYIRLPNRSEALLYEPAKAKSGVALLFTHPARNNFNEPLGREMATRGYRVLMVNYRGDDEFREADPEAYLPGLSGAIAWLKTVPGTTRVVMVGHSGGGHLVSLYGGVAEQGPAICSGPEKIYPCKTKGLAGLARIDGLVLLDATLGAFHQMSAIDPAIAEGGRKAALDMFDPANGYNPAARRATYSPAFAARFYAAQAADNARIVAHALARLSAIEHGKADYVDDEPLVIRGMGVRASGARLYQPDIAFAAHTRQPHLLLRADGTDGMAVIRSVRAPAGKSADDALRSLDTMAQNTTVRRFLAASAIRTGPDYAITADNIVGVDWKSAYNSTPAMAEGVTVPSLVMTMTCHYLVMPGEIIFDHLAASDKTYVAVDGATHGFAPCKPEYGDTTARTFDYLDRWLSQGRF